jgi:uncharacterized protein (DUF697 family)
MTKKLPGLRRTRRPKTEAAKATDAAAPEETPKRKSTRKRTAKRTSAKVAATSRRASTTAPVESPASDPPPPEPPLKADVTQVPDEAVEIIDPQEITPIEQEESLARRHRQAERIISRHAAWATAGGLIPLPLVDIAAVSATQVRLITALAELYGAPFSRDMVKACVAAVAGGVSPYAISFGTVSLLFKSMPGAGLAVGLVGMAGLSNLSTRVIGRIFAHHFASGGDVWNADLRALSQTYSDTMAKGGAD